MNDTPSKELLEELYKLADIDESFIEHGSIYNEQLYYVADMKDIAASAELVRLAIFRVQYRGYIIVPF